MIFTRAIKEDINALYTLEMATFEPWNSPLSKRSFAYHICKNLLVVAKENNELLGYILVLTSSRVPRIYSLAVDVKATNKGIATQLLQQTFLSLPTRDIRLEVRVDNEKAIGLYEKLGFKKIGTKSAYYDDGCDALVMKRFY